MSEELEMSLEEMFGEASCSSHVQAKFRVDVRGRSGSRSKRLSGLRSELMDLSPSGSARSGSKSLGGWEEPLS